MPRETRPTVWETVTFPELVTRIGGRTTFSIDDLVRMIASAEKNNEPFRLVDSDVNFEVPVDQIRDYFKDHPRPARRLTLQEENAWLKGRVKELEAVLAENGIIDPVTELQPHPSFIAPFVKKKVPPTAHKGILADEPPGRTPKEDAPMTVSQIQDELAFELRDKKPLTNDDARIAAGDK